MKGRSIEHKKPASYIYIEKYREKLLRISKRHPTAFRYQVFQPTTIATLYLDENGEGVYSISQPILNLNSGETYRISFSYRCEGIPPPKLAILFECDSCLISHIQFVNMTENDSLISFDYEANGNENMMTIAWNEIPKKHFCTSDSNNYLNQLSGYNQQVLDYMQPLSNSIDSTKACCTWRSFRAWMDVIVISSFNKPIEKYMNFTNR